MSEDSEQEYINLLKKIKYAKPNTGFTCIKKNIQISNIYIYITSVRCINAQEVPNAYLGMVTEGRSNSQESAQSLSHILQ